MTNTAAVKPISESAQSFQVLGARVHAMTMKDLHDAIAAAINDRARRVIANHNLHSIYLFHHDAKMRAFYSLADWVHVDGMPVCFIAWLRRLPIRRVHRVTYADWMVPLMEEAAKQRWRVFYLGSAPGVAEKGAVILQNLFPQLQLKVANGFFNSYVQGVENKRVVQMIRDYNPHLLMVGMGMPRQEYWILDNWDHLNANVVLNCGAAMDYVAGTVSTPPRMAASFGFEWLFRLVEQPGRLWRRYLVEPFFLVGFLLPRSWKRLKGHSLL